jgi:nucleoside-diphosphate kinase
MTAGPIVTVVLEGAHAVSIVRKLVGGTEPLTSIVGTIRGDFVLDSYQMSDAYGRAVRNVVHASGSVKEANDEIAHWFKAEELMKYKTISEKMLYDVNLDSILE